MVYFSAGEAIFRLAEVQKEIQLRFEDCVSVSFKKKTEVETSVTIHDKLLIKKQ